jgi:ElaB/YqjD/DUF883 family membrane-anchored ribosome-binding protein
MTGQNNAADITSDLQALKKDVAELMRQLLDRNRDRIMNAKDEVVDKANDALQTAEKQIKSRPFFSVLLAFVIGILFGAIARRV